MNHSPLSDIGLELESFKQKYKSLQDNIQKLAQNPAWFTDNVVCLECNDMHLREFSGNNNGGPPVLIVYSHVNRPLVIDLTQRHSVVQRLIEMGHRVFLLEWVDVNAKHCRHELSLYLHDYLDTAVDYIRNYTNVRTVNMIGICQGGTYALCYACLQPEKLNRLVTMVTPVDFHAGDNVLCRWILGIDFSVLEKLSLNIPGEVITLFFQSLRPFDDMIRQVSLIEHPPHYSNLELIMLMDQWVFDCPDQPGKAFSQFMQLFYQKNLLISGELELGELKINLKNIQTPVLNLYAEHDHLVPPESSKALRRHIRKDLYSEDSFKGGHIGLMVSEKAHKTMLPAMSKWLAEP